MSDSTDAFAVHDLGAVLRALSGGTGALDEQAGRAPDVPDAGGSSAHVAATMAAIAGAASAIVRSGAVAGARVNASFQSYQALDTGSGASFR